MTPFDATQVIRGGGCSYRVIESSGVDVALMADRVATPGWVPAVSGVHISTAVATDASRLMAIRAVDDAAGTAARRAVPGLIRGIRS